MPRKFITIDDWLAQGKELFGPIMLDWKFVCPMCKTAQTPKQLLELTGGDVDKTDGYMAYSCIGRLNGAGPYDPQTSPGKGCDWSLGGLLQIHETEVVFPNGRKRPVFEFAGEAKEAKP